jgi:hypothetical protein
MNIYAPEATSITIRYLHRKCPMRIFSSIVNLRALIRQEHEVLTVVWVTSEPYQEPRKNIIEAYLLFIYSKFSRVTFWNKNRD